jgi:hypothetical protein
MRRPTSLFLLFLHLQRGDDGSTTFGEPRGLGGCEEQ